ncbi:MULTISPECIES: ANTAR domain-containing protein [Rhodococcus]|jgi:hypothetical protein|uniref:ANTAR domain-containing protein n=1 Tax=Rhodococcus oxybenzonivorans TaxID=1990687 RepID=A0AAE4UX60_9NOCA|nr:MULTISPECIES: ANTAR domain-containing protein [Rhodococcus]MDV7242163.1 ANTAR domain-containing protein [Rhodococcus oxybenzonivorans]MDV7264630.1 ANTAR domain-containing protein [Rhodococcus oxybenzonivorans]MDV7276342.1 ANTAR domain-containing protein [Rhodococcus oxybenzonivorans]MDV7331651.1 ANTAR domain-containing protein [Rhodococcus oxybenzonivorans]MDV7343873.1 ANTAR domain-containing protein [Rhodococcus oxybenzonivorans]
MSTSLRLCPSPEGTTSTHPPGPGEILAAAKRILIASRGYGDAEAFEELLDVSRHHHVSVQRAARMLVVLADRRQAAPLPAGSSAMAFGDWATSLSPSGRPPALSVPTA